MKPVIIIYTTDPWHTFASREIIGVATTEKKRDVIVRRYLREYQYEKLNRDTINEAVKQVQQSRQTSILSEKTGFEIDTEEYDTNTVLE